MGLRYRKTIKLGPLNINMSKSGIGFSIGTKMFRIGISPKGKLRKTFTVPGTGISYVKETTTNKSAPNSDLLDDEKS